MSRTTRIAERLYYLFVGGPRGHGKPLPKKTWESQYKQGHWDYLHSLDEVARYMVIVGYISYLHQSPRVLDVGCGQGRLLEFLGAFGFRSYRGIDLSSEAIKKSEPTSENVRFEVADFEKWKSPERFDVVVFNESLYYARRPVEVLLRYQHYLNERGSMIVSIFRTGHRRAIWRVLNKHFAIVNSTMVKNHQGQVWDIQVIRPKAA